MRAWAWSIGVATAISAAHAGEPRDTVVIAVGAEPDTFIPPLSNSAAGYLVQDLIYEPLVESRFDCRLSYHPRLAKVRTGDDGRIDLTLRGYGAWPDGTPVSALDVRTAWDVIADPAYASPRIAYVDRIGQPIIDAPNRLHFQPPAPLDETTALSMATMYYLPAHLVAGLEPDALRDHPLARSPMPTGPWTLAEWEPRRHLVFRPNPLYRGPRRYRPHLAAVRFELIPEYETRILKLQRGEIDVLEGLRIRDLAPLRAARPDVTLHRRGYRFMDYVAWNLDRAPFDDLRVRRAFAHAVDIEAIIADQLTDETGERYGQPAVSTFTPELCDLRPDITPLAHDPDRARALLDEAGWVDSDGDGVRDRDGEPLTFRLVTNRENERRRRASATIQAALGEIGVQVDVDAIEFNAMMGRAHRRDFDALLAGWSAALFPDPSPFWTTGAGFNYPGYSDPEVDALIARGLATRDPAEAAPIWQEVQERIYADQPYLFLYWRDEVIAIDGRFQGAEPNVLHAYPDLHRWRVPAGEVKYGK